MRTELVHAPKPVSSGVAFHPEMQQEALELVIGCVVATGLSTPGLRSAGTRTPKGWV